MYYFNSQAHCPSNPNKYVFINSLIVIFSSTYSVTLERVLTQETLLHSYSPYLWQEHPCPSHEPLQLQWMIFISSGRVKYNGKLKSPVSLKPQWNYEWSATWRPPLWGQASQARPLSKMRYIFSDYEILNKYNIK